MGFLQRCACLAPYFDLTFRFFFREDAPISYLTSVTIRRYRADSVNSGSHNYLDTAAGAVGIQGVPPLSPRKQGEKCRKTEPTGPVENRDYRFIVKSENK